MEVMMNRALLLQIGLGVGFALVVACSGGSTTVDSTSSSSGSSSGALTPQEEATVSPPSSALEVTASIIAVTLGDDCGSSKSGSFAPAGDCAPDPDGGGCSGGSLCRESNVQLSFKTGNGSNAKVEITEVTLHDGKTGGKVATLTASSPQSWNGTEYAAWDQTLAPSSDVKASYDLSSPTWSSIEKDGKSSYSSTYRLRVALKIDGVAILLESRELNREPAVAT
jgi:hypothetical protein